MRVQLKSWALAVPMAEHSPGADTSLSGFRQQTVTQLFKNGGYGEDISAQPAQIRIFYGSVRAKSSDGNV